MCPKWSTADARLSIVHAIPSFLYLNASRARAHAALLHWSYFNSVISQSLRNMSCGMLIYTKHNLQREWLTTFDATFNNYDVRNAIAFVTIASRMPGHISFDPSWHAKRSRSLLNFEYQNSLSALFELYNFPPPASHSTLLVRHAMYDRSKAYCATIDHNFYRSLIELIILYISHKEHQQVGCLCYLSLSKSYLFMFLTHNCALKLIIDNIKVNRDLIILLAVRFRERFVSML